jgi:hypothetical protein
MAPTGIANGIGIGPFGGRATFLPTDIAGAVLWLRADFGITEAGSGVSVWADQSGNGNDFAQGTDANRPAHLAAGWSTGRDTVDFVAGNTEHLEAAAYSGTSATYTVFAALDQRSNATTLQTLLSSSSGNHVVSAVNANGFVGGYDGTAWRDCGDAIDGEQLLTWLIDHTANTLTCRRNGSEIGSAAWANNSPIVATVYLGRYSGGGHQANYEMAELVVYDRALDAGEISQVEVYLRAKYGL